MLATSRYALVLLILLGRQFGYPLIRLTRDVLLPNYSIVHERTSSIDRRSEYIRQVYPGVVLFQ